MNEPTPLTSERLLPVAVAMARRRRQQQRGVALLLSPLPDCPTCATAAEEVVTGELDFPHNTLRVLFRPCGHRFTVTAEMAYEVARQADVIVGEEENQLAGEHRDLLAEYTVPAGEVQSIGQQEPPEFVIQLHADDGTLIVGIRPDGSIQQGPNYQPDEAAREFWDAVTRAAQSTAPWRGSSDG